MREQEAHIVWRERRRQHASLSAPLGTQRSRCCCAVLSVRDAKLEGPWRGPSVLAELQVWIGRAYRALAVENANGLGQRPRGKLSTRCKSLQFYRPLASNIDSCMPQ